MLRRTADYFMGERDNDPPHDPDGHLAFNIARVCAEVAERGGHPEAAPKLERELCAVAGLPDPQQERNDRQHELPLP